MQPSAGAHRAPKWKQLPAPDDRHVKYAPPLPWYTHPGCRHAVVIGAWSGSAEPLPPPPGLAEPLPPPALPLPPPPGVVVRVAPPGHAAITSRATIARARTIAPKLPRRLPRCHSRAVSRFADAPLLVPPACADAVIAAWSTPPRAYHDLAHLDAVLAAFHDAAARAPWHAPREVYWALACHDAIYVAGAADNEARSADLAEALARAHLAPELDHARVRELVLATARHGALGGEPLDDDTARLLDCDLAILGAAPAVFDRYDAAVAIEYGHVPAAAYRAGRRRFLAGLLAAPRIFCSDDGHRRLDAAARSNLSRAIARLDAPG